MKVLHISTNDFGGAGVAAIRIHKSLLEAGVDSKFICLNRESKGIDKVFKWGRRNDASHFKRILRKLKLSRSQLQKRFDLMKDLEGNFEFFSLPYTDYNLAEHPLVKDADIIHLHWVSDFLDFKSFFTRVKKPIVWTIHDLNPMLGGFHYENDMKANKQMKKLDEKLKLHKHKFIKSSDIHYVGVSKWTTLKIIEYLGSDVKCSTIFSPLDFNIYKPISKLIAKQALGLDNEKLIIGIGAQLIGSYRKGYWVLLDAYNKLSDSEKDIIQFISFGSDLGSVNQFKNLINFGPINNDIFQTIIYSAMDCFVIPSIEEAFGLTGIEAVSCGTPLIGSKVGGISDYLQEGVNGVFFEKANSDDLLEKLRLFIHSKNYLEKSIKCSRSLIIQNFSKTQSSKSYISLYNRLA
jgi:glycosyltransferase involved in cell wall biosynthesis